MTSHMLHGPKYEGKKKSPYHADHHSTWSTPISTVGRSEFALLRVEDTIVHWHPKCKALGRAGLSSHSDSLTSRSLIMMSRICVSCYGWTGSNEQGQIDTPYIKPTLLTSSFWLMGATPCPAARHCSAASLRLVQARLRGTDAVVVSCLIN